MMDKTCPICGRSFEAHRARKYCSEECSREAKNNMNRIYMQEKRKPTSDRSSVDERLRSCHAAGQTYAEAQQAETIEKFARVEVPEAFMMQAVETPEKPAKEKIMFLSREEREVLIRIQVQVETLQEYFKFNSEATGMDYPGVVLGKVLEQVTQLLGEGEA